MRVLNCKLIKFYLNILLDKLKTICKILILHPLYVNMWMKLFDCLVSRVSENKFKLFCLICLEIIEEINKHGNKYRSEIFNEQKSKRQAWVHIKKRFILNGLFFNCFYKFNEANKMLNSLKAEKYILNTKINVIKFFVFSIIY